MITYNIYRHPHTDESELIDTMETGYSIVEGNTVITEHGPMIVKKVIVEREGSVRPYATAVLGFSDGLF
jgi:hypothetical protein